MWISIKSIIIHEGDKYCVRCIDKFVHSAIYQDDKFINVATKQPIKNIETIWK